MNGIQMNIFQEIDGMSRRQERIIRRMMIFSFVVHIVVFVMGSVLSPLFSTTRVSPPMFVELTDFPMSELPEEVPPPPTPIASSTRPESSRTSSDMPASTRPAPKDPPAARRWLDKLDAGMSKVPEAPVTRREGKAGGIPVRHWTNEGPAKAGDFAPAVSPEKSAALGKHMGELEARVRGSGRPGVGFGKETEASMMFGGAGDTGGEPIPAWVREMIRKRVRDRLPELEGVYADAIRRNSDLQGKLFVRFRIDPSGKVQSAELTDGSFPDAAFVNSVLAKVRRWTFEPPAGRTVEVLYPFVFVAPS
ncbi:MAG: putative abductin-like protein [Deltaproteobacteria bacterium]|nr:putative abductin-like protein [Deltaproteobacteria bacterium]MBP2689968.1 putative abductin-like protein [Deltaproteobacteria bacterium]